MRRSGGYRVGKQFPSVTILSTEHGSDGAPPELLGDGGVDRLRLRFRPDRKPAGTIIRAAIDWAPNPLDGSASNSSVLLPVRLAVSG